MAVSADGRYIYTGEGGSIAILDTDLPNQDGYRNSARRVPISKFGARPAKILVDPGPAPGFEDDKLIVCAGRSGLWIMDAHPAGPVYRAAVVDDSGNGDVNIQKSRRFCSDAVLFTIDGVEYLAATFAKKNQSRLRIYDMASVRAVLDNTPAGEWSGHEVDALHDVKIKRRTPVLTLSDPATNTHNYSLTIGLDVDQISSSEATLYMALWHQGLGRVRVAAGSGGALSVSGLEFGPVFGQGTSYNTDPAFTAEKREWYSNMRYREDGVVYREEPPVFTDVAVQNFCGGHYLYATIDTLGWIRLDLFDESVIPWAPDMPLDHHEGEVYPVPPTPHPMDEIQFRLAEIDGEDYTYPRQVRVVDTGDRAILAVNAVCGSIVEPVGHRTEGSIFNYEARLLNGFPIEIFGQKCGEGLLAGGGEHTFFYDLGCDTELISPLMTIPTGVPSLNPPEEDPAGLPFLKGQAGGSEMELLATADPNQMLLFVQRVLDTTKSWST